MKRIIKFALVTFVIVLSLSLFGCEMIEELFNGGNSYSFSDIVMTQTGVKSFKIEFTANCGNDDVKIYFTESFRLQSSDVPKTVEKNIDGRNARFSFTEDLQLGEDYYLWVVADGKEAMLSITAPSMFPSISTVDDGSAIFNFKYTYGVPWDAFCDPEGKAVYESSSPVFDRSATVIRENVAITEESALIPSYEFEEDKYYYAVSTAKDGLLKIISRPVVLSENIINQIEGISAKITNQLAIQVDVKVAEDLAEQLQLVVKSSTADETYVVDSVYSGGVATMSFDCTQLQYDGLWYDICLTWRGAIITEIPKTFNGQQVDTVPTVKKDGVLYNLIGWKPEEADESATMLKVYFETDTTRYADEFCKSYLVTFSVDPEPTINVTLKLKDNLSDPPVLAITGGDKVKIAYIEGRLNEDGSYSYSLPVSEAFTEADKWYDIRLFFGDTACELLKDSCITYSDFSGKYTDNGNARVYEFREYNGMLKMMYTDISAQ